MRAHLIRIDALDSAGDPAPIFAASVDDRRLCHLDGVQWVPAIARLPVLRYDLFGGDFGSAIATPAGQFSLAAGAINGFADRRYPGARVRIWSGTLGDAFGAFTLRFDGLLKAEPTVTAGIASFEASANDAWMDEPLLDLFDGTGGLEGSEDLEGTVKPLALGACRFAFGQLTDAVDNVYCVSGHGAIEAMSKAYDRVNSLGAPTGDHASLAALLAATIPNGGWATCLVAGRARLGAPPDGQVSFDISGDKVAGFVRKPGALIGRIAELAGGSVDPVNLAALDAARPWNLSLQLLAQTTAREVIQQIAASVVAVAGISWTGKLFVQPYGFGTSSMDLRTDGTAWPPVGEVTVQPVAAPFWRLATQAEPTWVVHDPASVATDLIYREVYSDDRVYRLDDWVTVTDGSSWKYINAVPSAGHAPPAWPTTSDSWWENLSPPTGGEDGGVALAAATEALALARARGKLTIGGALPAVADSNPGDTHVADDGTFYDRVNDGGILLGGFAVVLAGYRPRLAWTPSVVQPLRDVIGTAASAAAAADDALDQLIGLADDGVISINEKITKLIPAQARLAEKYAVLYSQAVALAVSTSEAAAAKGTWDALLAGLSPAWNNTDADTPVSRSAFDAARNDFDQALYDLDAAIKTKASTLANWAGVSGSGKPEDNATYGATAAQAAAIVAAQSAADDAAADATAAIGELLVISNDAVLDISEKPAVVQQVTAITAEQSDIDAKATAYGITTEKTAYDNAISALASYLAALSPTWNSYAAHTAITRSTFNAKFTDVYSARQILLNKIAEKAGTTSTWSGVSGSGKPADNATVGAPSGTNVGSTPSTTVETGANAANNGVNSDGSIKTGKVDTGAIATNGATVPYFTESSSTINFPSGSTALIRQLVITKEIAGSILEVSSQIELFGADAVDLDVECSLWTYPADVHVVSKDFRLKVDANNSTNLPTKFDFNFSGVAVGDYYLRLMGTRFSANTCSTSGDYNLKSREFKR